MVIFVKRSFLFSLCAVFIFGITLFLLVFTSVYAINVDDRAICYVKTFRQGRNAIDDYLKGEEQRLGKKAKIIEKVSLEYCVRNPEISFSDVATAKSLLKQNTSFDIEYKESVAIPSETKVLPSDKLPSGVEEMIYSGSDGEQENTLHAVVSNEEVSNVEIVDSEVVVEAKNAVILQGTSPNFYPIVANGGLGRSPIPVAGEITAVFGSSGDLWSSTHTGLDISAVEGAQILSVGCGIVTKAEENGCYGNMVAVDHGNGIITRYAHLSSFAVHIGDKVETGTLLGYCGSTGNATGSHLHFEVMRDGNVIDPQSYFSEIIG